MIKVKIAQLICNVIWEKDIDNNLKMTIVRLKYEWKFIIAINLKSFLWFQIIIMLISVSLMQSMCTIV